MQEKIQNKNTIRKKKTGECTRTLSFFFTDLPKKRKIKQKLESHPETEGSHSLDSNGRRFPHPDRVDKKTYSKTKAIY